MQKFVNLFHHEIDGGIFKSELTRVPEFVKAHADGAYRSILFGSEDSPGAYGPMVFVFTVKRARDLLLDGCEYHGVEMHLESGGRKLPQLPVAAELARFLAAEDTIVLVNGNPYKPHTEVYGFQQVYEDSVKCIDSLKRLGIAQDNMSIFATPEEISIEVHPGPLGIEGDNDTADLYYRLLCHIGEIKEAAGKPLKTVIKTLDLNIFNKEYRLLLPGSNHPSLHRPRVNVGTSHFAYGIAAFSDYCSKKRTQQECLQETFNWVKFVQTALPAIAGLREKIAQMPLLPAPGATMKGKKLAAASACTLSSGRFQPFKNELETAGAGFTKPLDAIPSVSSGLDRALGGGWTSGGIHLIVGPREAGKGSLLLQQALTSESRLPLLYLSYEHGFREFVGRAAASAAGLNISDTLAQLPLASSAGEHARISMTAAVEALRARLGSNLHFTGVEAARSELDAEEIRQLASMMTSDANKLVLLESIELSDLMQNSACFMRQLREVASAAGLTIIITVHALTTPGKRPHFIDEADLPLLDKLQKYCDSILVLQSEKVNLRKFVAMVKGQIDAALVGSLEQKALQLAGGKRLKTDTYTLAKLIHTRSGRREILLYLYQPDLLRFFELATIPLQRP